jgi:hypothetical protein
MNAKPQNKENTMELKELKVKKIRAADTSHGRGMDNYKTPARYGIFDQDGNQVGVLRGSDYGYMERPTWDLDVLHKGNWINVRTFWKGFKEAKGWVADTLPGVLAKMEHDEQKAQEEDQDENPFGPVISSYTAAQAEEDGILVDVSEMAHEAGFKNIVRITRTVHDLCTPPKSNKIQSYNGRLWDVLYLASMAVRAAARKGEESMTTYRVKIGRKIHELWVCIDTTSGPAIHIMTPEDY